VYIPYVKGISEKFKRIVNRYNITTLFKTKNALRSSLMKARPESDPQQTAQCIYSIPCECGRSYIGETGTPLAVQLREHRHNLQQGFLEKSKLAQHAYEEGHRIEWDGARILEIESNSRYRKYKESAHMACLTNPISQPVWTFPLSGSPSSAMRSPTHREDKYDGTDSSWVSIRFRSRVFRFYS
jgi:predicted GIY-YIG superfamily endonuclease